MPACSHNWLVIGLLLFPIAPDLLQWEEHLYFNVSFLCRVQYYVQSQWKVKYGFLFLLFGKMLRLWGVKAHMLACSY